MIESIASSFFFIFSFLLYLILLATLYVSHSNSTTGVTSLLVAAKMEEVYPPKAKELAATTAGASTDKDILDFEKELMQTLEWRLAPPTVDDWTGW